DRTLRTEVRRRGKLRRDVNDLVPIVADREGAGGSAHVDANVVSQRRILVARRDQTGKRGLSVRDGQVTRRGFSRGAVRFHRCFRSWKKINRQGRQERQGKTDRPIFFAPSRLCV